MSVGGGVGESKCVEGGVGEIECVGGEVGGSFWW